MPCRSTGRPLLPGSDLHQGFLRSDCRWPVQNALCSHCSHSSCLSPFCILCMRPVSGCLNVSLFFFFFCFFSYIHIYGDSLGRANEFLIFWREFLRVLPHFHRETKNEIWQKICRLRGKYRRFWRYEPLCFYDLSWVERTPLLGQKNIRRRDQSMGIYGLRCKRQALFYTVWGCGQNHLTAHNYDGWPSLNYLQAYHLKNGFSSGP